MVVVACLKVEEVGWRHLTSPRARAAAVNRARRLKQPGQRPPPFPNGWFVLLESRQLGRAEVRQVDALGLNLAVWRGESGRVFVTAAYCPHLGANLAAGGRVHGDSIQCPFHSWQFCGESGAVGPGCGAPSQARVRTFHCLERNFLIMVIGRYLCGTGEDWCCGRCGTTRTGRTRPGSRPASPRWRPPAGSTRAATSSPSPATSRQQSNNNNIRSLNINSSHPSLLFYCHEQDIPENGADVGHLAAIHSASILTGGEPTQREEELAAGLARHHWQISWQPGTGPLSHTSTLQLKHTKKLLNRFNIFRWELLT